MMGHPHAQQGYRAIFLAERRRRLVEAYAYCIVAAVGVVVGSWAVLEHLG